MHSFLFLAAFSQLFLDVPAAALEPRLSLSLSAYAPVTAVCPTTPLVRTANSASTSEASYVSSRQTKANTALASWLKSLNATFDTSKLPQLGLTTSGGGYRSLLNGAGVVQGLDARDSKVSTSGVYQGLTYEAGLSGGGWLLSSIAGNNWPTVTSLKTSLWETAFQDTLIDPGNLTVGVADLLILSDIAAKQAAGYYITITDVWGRLLSYQLLEGTDGGVATTLSGLTTKSNFTSFNVPFPIITSIGVQNTNQCIPLNNNPQYELTPYEFGSWDTGIKAFTQTAYLGSVLNNGKPANALSCVKNYDNLGFVLGTTSDLFSGACEVSAVNDTSNLADALEGIVSSQHPPALEDLYSIYPNPFANYSSSYSVSSQPDLFLVDGGLSNQNNPIWPFIQPARNVSVLIVNDNSADTSDNFPNGTEPPTKSPSKRA